MVALHETLIAIGAWLRDEKMTLAVAESLTAGRVQALLTSQPGASDFFLGGITAYNLDQKVRQLHVNAAFAATCHSVSQQTAEEMAEGALRLFQSDWAIATTGYAQPELAHDVQEPLAWIATIGPAGRRFVDCVRPTGTREEVLAAAAEAAVRQLAAMMA